MSIEEVVANGWRNRRDRLKDHRAALIRTLDVHEDGTPTTSALAAIDPFYAVAVAELVQELTEQIAICGENAETP